MKQLSGAPHGRALALIVNLRRACKSLPGHSSLLRTILNNRCKMFYNIEPRLQCVAQNPDCQGNRKGNRTLVNYLIGGYHHQRQGIIFTTFQWIGQNKLECYITSGWKGLQGKNNLAYWAHL